MTARRSGSAVRRLATETSYDPYDELSDDELLYLAPLRSALYAGTFGSGFDRLVVSVLADVLRPRLAPGVFFGGVSRFVVAR